MEPHEQARLKLGVYPSDRRQLELLVQDRPVVVKKAGRMEDPPEWMSPGLIQLIEVWTPGAKATLRVCHGCSRAILTGKATKRCKMCNESGQLVTVPLVLQSR